MGKHKSLQLWCSYEVREWIQVVDGVVATDITCISQSSFSSFITMGIVQHPSRLCLRMCWPSQCVGWCLYFLYANGKADLNKTRGRGLHAFTPMINVLSTLQKCFVGKLCKQVLALLFHTTKLQWSVRKYFFSAQCSHVLVYCTQCWDTWTSVHVGLCFLVFSSSVNVNQFFSYMSHRCFSLFFFFSLPSQQAHRHATCVPEQQIQRYFCTVVVERVFLYPWKWTGRSHVNTFLAYWCHHFSVLHFQLFFSAPSSMWPHWLRCGECPSSSQ